MTLPCTFLTPLIPNPPCRARLQLSVKGIRKRDAARRRLRPQRQRRDQRILQRVRVHVPRTLAPMLNPHNHAASGSHIHEAPLHDNNRLEKSAVKNTNE